MFRLLSTRIPVHIEYILSLSGYIWVIISLREYLTSVPIVYPALIVSTLTHALRFYSRELYYVMYWVIFYAFVFQLITIHENNLCLLDECKVTELQKYIALASTLIMVLQPRPEKTTFSMKLQPPDKIRLVKLNVSKITKQHNQGKKINLNFESNSTNVKWV